MDATEYIYSPMIGDEATDAIVKLTIFALILLLAISASSSRNKK